MIEPRHYITLDVPQVVVLGEHTVKVKTAIINRMIVSRPTVVTLTWNRLSVSLVVKLAQIATGHGIELCMRIV